MAHNHTANNTDKCDGIEIDRVQWQVKKGTVKKKMRQHMRDSEVVERDNEQGPSMLQTPACTCCQILQKQQFCQ